MIIHRHFVGKLAFSLLVREVYVPRIPDKMGKNA